MIAAEHVVSYLRVIGIKQCATLVTPTKTLVFCGARWMWIGQEILRTDYGIHSHDEW